MKVAVYARVSTEDQAQAGTIEVQLHAVRKYCEDNGHEIVEMFADEGVSGAVPLADRPAGRQLIDAAEAQRGRKERKFEAVVVYSLDRLGREAIVALLAIERLKGLKVPAVFVRESFDDSPAGKFQQTVMSAVSELERGLITARMSGGRLRSVREGNYLSSVAPFGYRFETEWSDEGKKHRRRILVDDVQAPWVVRMFEWAAFEGVGLKEIADRLDAGGVKEPMSHHPKRRSQFGWSWSTVAKILKARRYLGEGSYGSAERFGIEVMKCPPIVSAELFEATQKALARRRFDATRNARHFYLLRNLLRCGACGANMQGRIKRLSPDRVVNEYECGRRRQVGPRAGHENVTWRVREDEIAPRIMSAVDQIIAAPERAVADMAIEVERTRQRVDTASDRVRELERRLAEFPQQEQRVTDAYRRGQISGALLGQQLDAISDERKAVQAQLTEVVDLSSEGEATVAMLELVHHWLSSGQLRSGNPHTVYDEARGEEVSTADAFSPEEWRKRITAIVKTVTVQSDGALQIEGPGDVIYCMTSR